MDSGMVSTLTGMRVVKKKPKSYIKMVPGKKKISGMKMESFNSFYF